MIIGEKFYNLCEKLEIGKWEFNFLKREFILSFDEVHKLDDLKIVFNGENGGFVLGNSHDYGGIHLIQLDVDRKIVKYAGEMEGFEYLSSPIKSELQKKEFLEINKLTPEIDDLKELIIPKNCNLIDTRNIEVPVILVSIYEQFIFNKKSSIKNIEKIIEIEKKY
tara:strand:+ start:96 stop:590 length:495 start_codon:yes stop_codon:yes gene_type:complete